jgi:hypothetical protein
MQDINSRFVLLIALFAISVLALGIVEPSTVPAAPRWPDQESLYQVEGWQTTAPTVELVNGVEYVTRDYHNLTGQRATLTISTSPVAKRVYRAGPDVPFLGNGYVVEPAPHIVAASGAGGRALVARKGDQSWLQIHVYGERRGQLGTGVLAWALSVVDNMAAQLNDYYLLRIVVPFNNGDEREAQAAESLAGTLFPRVGAWYAGVEAV